MSQLPRIDDGLTYREEIAQLDSLATPGPWTSEGELYGVRESRAFMPLGFAPHRPLDSRLIAVYRSAVMELIGAVNAIERLVVRSRANPSTPAAIVIRQVLTTLDAVEGEGHSFRDTLADLDRTTTPPPWDAGHLVLGMELDAQLRASLGIGSPASGDTQLIATARIAVPRALDVLACAEENIARHGLLNGSLRLEGVLAIAGAVAAFDQHSAGEGSSTGTV
ncbi:MAG: hypothetical protein ACYDCS_03195 [Candidatus Dormibacteria bacterium]